MAGHFRGIFQARNLPCQRIARISEHAAIIFHLPPEDALPRRVDSDLSKLIYELRWRDPGSAFFSTEHGGGEARLVFLVGRRNMGIIGWKRGERFRVMAVVGDDEGRV